jgi:hypothetical protein
VCDVGIALGTGGLASCHEIRLLAWAAICMGIDLPAACPPAAMTTYNNAKRQEDCRVDLLPAQDGIVSKLVPVDRWQCSLLCEASKQVDGWQVSSC